MREVLLDAAERLFVSRGVRVATMEVIAREAGYSRTAIYRQFPSRRDVHAALVARTTQRHMMAMIQQIPADAGPLDVLVESLVIVATELVNDPLLKTIADQTPDGTVASLIATDGDLSQMVESMIANMIAADTAGEFRDGLDPGEVAHFVIATALSLLMGLIPGTSEQRAARKYLRTFFLPAIAADA